MSSNLKRFADDKLVYGFAHNVNDTLSLQLDLDRLVPRGGGGVLPKDLGGGVQSTSGNPYPISDQNFMIFPTLFQTLPKT